MYLGSVQVPSIRHDIQRAAVRYKEQHLKHSPCCRSSELSDSCWSRDPNSVEVVSSYPLRGSDSVVLPGISTDHS